MGRGRRHGRIHGRLGRAAAGSRPVVGKTRGGRMEVRGMRRTEVERWHVMRSDSDGACGSGLHGLRLTGARGRIVDGSGCTGWAGRRTGS